MRHSSVFYKTQAVGGLWCTLRSMRSLCQLSSRGRAAPSPTATCQPLCKLLQQQCAHYSLWLINSDTPQHWQDKAKTKESVIGVSLQIAGKYVPGGGQPYAGAINFYATYSNDTVHRKPFCVPETAALYNVDQAGQGASEYDVKRTWWSQVCSDLGCSSQLGSANT